MVAHIHVNRLFSRIETKEIEVPFKSHWCALTCYDANWHFETGTKC